MLSSLGTVRPTGGCTWVLDAILFQGGFRTDLHDALHIFHGTVGRDLELFTYFLGESLEPRPREPAWKVPHCPTFRQLLVDARLSA